MKKIEQLQLQQLNHDKEYHKDIYLQSTVFKLKHFTLHYSKYLSRLILSNNLENEIRKILLDSFIISLSFANTLNFRLEDVDLIPNSAAIKDEHFLDYMGKLYATGLLSISKGLDNYDHFDDYNKQSLEIGVCVILDLIERAIDHFEWSTFESDLLMRYQSIRNKRLA